MTRRNLAAVGARKQRADAYILEVVAERGRLRDMNSLEAAFIFWKCLDHIPDHVLDLETSVEKAQSEADSYAEAKSAISERDQERDKRNKRIKVISDAINDLETFAEAIRRFKAQREGGLQH